MGLAGAEVDALGLERLIGHGTDPRDGHGLGRSYSPDNDDVVAGFGLTFSPPKSVSVLWGTGGEQLRTAVVAAYERAVASTLDFLQDHAAFTRRGRRRGRPLESRAARTRSRASRQAASGSPRTAKPGKPFETCTSTRTGRPRTPSRVADGMEAITSELPAGRLLVCGTPWNRRAR